MRFLIYLLCISVNCNLYAQILNRDPKNLFPFSPETSSIVRYQEIPVGNYTGVPNISIPVYTVKSNGLEIPITLNYHAGGVLVSDIPSSVGLGWSLQTISPITRKINGYIDERGIMLNNDNIANFLNHDISNRKSLMNALVYPTNSSVADIMPDEFNISIPDFSGQFLYNSETKKLITFPLSDLQINYSLSNKPIQIRGIDIINVTDTKGIEYVFGGDGTEISGFDQSISYNGATSWKIKRIKDTSDNEITFSYTSNEVSRWENMTGVSHTVYNLSHSRIGTCPASFDETFFNNWESSYPFTSGDTPGGSAASQYIGTETLTEQISFSDGTLQFLYSNRLDFTNQKKLDKIIVKDLYGKTISEKRFNYDYFITSGLNNPTLPGTEDRTRKLKLISFQECDRDNKCLTTNFEYYENAQMPERQSYAFDYWGYFNNLKSTGFPKVPIKVLNQQTNTPYLTLSNTKYQSIANRNVDPNYTKTYSLKSIKYPEGGKNEFVYEANMASGFITTPNPDHYYFDAGAYPDMTRKYDSFIVSGYVENTQIYTGFPSQPSYSDNYSKTYVKEIDISKYDKGFEMKYSYNSSFKASSFSNNLLAEALYSLCSVYYYNDSNIKTYWIKDIAMSQSGSLDLNRYNNQVVPSKKIYVEIKHIYWGGLGNNITNSQIPFSSYFNIEWDERKPNTENINFYGGGIRVKEIKIYDNDGSYKNSFTYSYLKEDAKTSSGILFNIPIYVLNTRIGELATAVCSDGSGYSKRKLIHDGTEISVRPVISGMTTQGKSVGYSRVEVSKIDLHGGINGKEIFIYHTEKPFPTGDNFLANLEDSPAKYEFLENRDWRNGRLLKNIIMNHDSDTIRKTELDYYIYGPPKISTPQLLSNNVKSIYYRLIPGTDYGLISFRSSSMGSLDPDDRYAGIYSTVMGLGEYNTTMPVFTKHNDAFLLKEERKTEYFGGNKAVIKTEYYYDDALYPLNNTSQKTTFPDLSYQTKEYRYAHEKGNQFLAGKNIVGIPLETEVKKNGVVISKSETKYPVSQDDADEKTSGMPLPLSVSSLDLQSNAMNMGVLYKKYDSHGNILQYNLKPDVNGSSGNPVTIIWGYNQTKPIAKIEGAKLSDIPQGLITNIVNASDYSNPSYSESNLIDQLDAFRIGLPGYQISTYTYKPLIGVSSITPPSGIREIYIYDTANRLQAVKDVNGNVLKEYKYHYKP